MADTPEDREAPKRAWMTPESRSRRLILGLGIYAACAVVFAVVCGDRLWVHTDNNHFAFLADAWLHGRQALAGMPPQHSQGNDWALFEGKWYVSFPPFPALLMTPMVALAGDPDNFRDAQFIVWLAGIGPAVLFLVLEKLRRTGRSERSEIDDIRLALLFAFGTVYFFTAVQGTVWYAAHVVGVGLAAVFVLVSLDAERPMLAGLLLGMMFMTRVTTSLVAVFFAFEAIRASCKDGELSFAALDRGALTKRIVRFSIPVVATIVLASYYNWTRFHTSSPTAFGHEFLQVGWQARIQRWGLFSYHYLGRNLAAMFAGLPWVAPAAQKASFGAPFKINGHGLALWFTTPIYVWLLHPKKWSWVAWGALAAAAGPMVMNLLYQNSGWVQFGYRFSNDYAILLFVLLAVGGRKLGRGFWLAAAWAVAWNTFGAVTFERTRTYYVYDNEHVYQPD